MNPVDVRDYDCVHGHFAATKYDAMVPQTTKVTWLRDPVERLASHYEYWKRKPDMENSLCRALHREKWTLLEFASQPALRNLQTRYLDGVPLEHFEFVGVQERFDELFPVFLDTIGGPQISAGSGNVNPEKLMGARYSLADSVRIQIEALHAEDIELYRRASSRVD